VSLAHRTYSAVRWTTTATLVRTGLQLAQIAILARFLAPQDYGLMAMVTVVLSYAGLFSDMGLSIAFVQRQEISSDERSSLYWLNVIVGSVLTICVVVVSPIASSFFNEPRLVPLIMLVSSNFLVISLGQQLRMDAEKALNFRPVAFVEMTAVVAGFATAVCAAWLGCGVYALVFGSMTNAWVGTAMSWVILANGWRPAKRMRWSDVRWFVRFGGGMVVNNIINHVNATVDLLLGGRLLGAAQLGIYSVPRNLILQVQSMVNPIFTRVGFPLIASIQHDKEQVRQIYLTTMNLTASINAPIYVAIAVFGQEMVHLLLGGNWLEAAPLLRILAVWGLIRSFGNPVGSLLFGMGRVKLAAKWNAALMLVIPPVVWLGSSYGVFGMAWAMVILMAVLFIPGWALLVRPTCGAKLGEYFKQIAIPVLCAVLAGSVGWFVGNCFTLAVLRLTIGLLVGAIVYIYSSWVINKDWCLMMAKGVRAFGE